MSAARTKLTAKGVLKHVALVMLGAYALYLLVVHIVIATPLLRKVVNREPDDLLVDYGTAWSLWPGRVHVKGLRIRFKDSLVEGYISFDTLVGTFDVPSLFAKQLRVRDIDATGTAIRVRERLAPGHATEDALEGVAEIPGFSDPPLQKTTPRKAITDENYDPIAIDLEDVRIDSLRELWIGPYRFTGDARVTGGFYVRPNRKFMLRPSTMVVRSGDLTLAKRLFGQEVRGTIEAKIAMHDPRAVDGIEFFRYVDTRVRLESAVEDLGFLRRWLGPRATVAVSLGKGRAKSDVRVVGGVVEDGSWLDAEAHRTLVHGAGRGSAWLDVVGKLRVDGGQFRGAMTFTDIRVERRYAEAFPLRAERLDLLATSRSVDLANKPGDDLLVSVDLPRGVLTDVRALTGMFGRETALEKGVVHVKLHADYSVREGLLKGELSVDTPNLAMTIANAHVTAAAALGARLSRLDIGAMSGTIPHAYIDVRNASVRAAGGGTPPPPWWGRLDVKDLAIDKTEKPVASGSFAFAARDARPALHVVDAKTQSIPEWAKVPLAMEGLNLVGRIELGPGIGLEKVHGEGGSIDIGGRVHKEGKHTDGEMILALGPMSLKIDLGAGGGVKPGIGGGPKTGH